MGVILHITEGSGGSEGGAGMVRLEHPRCAVMVEVLDQYTQIQRRLEPYLARYYQAMANDPAFSDWVSNPFFHYSKYPVTTWLSIVRIEELYCGSIVMNDVSQVWGCKIATEWDESKDIQRCSGLCECERNTPTIKSNEMEYLKREGGWNEQEFSV